MQGCKQQWVIIRLSNIVFSQGSKLAVVRLSQTTKIINGATNLCRVVAPRTTQSAKTLAPWGIHITAFCFGRIIITRVYSRAQPCGISAICKKMLQINFATSNEAQKKIDPRISTIFLEIKYLKTPLTTILIWRPLHKLTFNFYSLLLSLLPFSSSFESLFNQTNIQDSAVIWARTFSVAQHVPKCWQSIQRVRPVFSWNSLHQFWRTPFLEKGAHLTLIGQFPE